MKAIAILLGLVLVVSIGFNVLLWRQVAQHRPEIEAVRARAADAESLKAANEAMEKAKADQAEAAEGEKRELARLRNEVSQLRRQAKEADGQRARMEAQNAALGANQAEIKTLSRSVDTDGLSAEEIRMMETAKLTPEQVVALRSEAQSTACVSNMKQIGLALHVWAQDYNGAFPPSLISATNELGSPKVLFCPAATGGVQAKDWAQLNPGTISYQYLNPNGNVTDSQKPLLTCPIHGHMGQSDGSVHRK